MTIRPLPRWTLDDRPVTRCWPLNGSDRTRRPAFPLGLDLPPPTSAAAGWRPTLMPTVAMILREYVRVQQHHASTRTPPTHLGSQQHTHRSILDTSTYNPLAIVPALPSSRLPRHEPGSAHPPLYASPTFTLLSYCLPLAHPICESTTDKHPLPTSPRRSSTQRPTDLLTTSPPSFLPSFLPHHLAPHPHSHPTHTTLRTRILRHCRTTDPIDCSIRPGSDVT